MSNTPKPLWTPSEEAIADSELVRFYQYLRSKFAELPMHYDYAALHAWTIDQPANFWRALWNYFEVIGEPGDSTLIQPKAMPGAEWFPNGRLNFAENLLRHIDEGVAITQRGEDGRRQTLTYQQLQQQVAQLAGFLREQGVGEGDRVAAFLPNSHYAVVGMLATTSLGAVWSSCSPDFGFSGVLDRFAQIEPKVLIACNGYCYGGKSIDSRERVTQICDALPSLEATIVAPYRDDIADELKVTNSYCWSQFVNNQREVPKLTFKRVPFSAPLYILYSSGTTGKPKCIVHSVGGTLLQHIKELALHTNVRKNEPLFYYTTCGWMMWNWLVSGLALGANIVIYDGSPFHPQQTHLWDIAEQEHIVHFGASAKFYSACEKYHLAPGTSHNLELLRTLLSTGSPLAHESFDYIYREIKADVCLASISGGTDIVSCFALGNPTLPVYRGELQCAGLGMDLQFYSENGARLKRGKGELVCATPFPSMPTGFWKDSDRSRYRKAYFERFPGVWAHGDYGEFVEHTSPSQRGVVIHGRSDAVLNPGGVRIGTAEIYRQVEKIDAVFESIAVGQTWQDDVRVILFVRLRNGLSLDAHLIAEIKNVIRQNTTPRHVPAKVIQVSDIPRTLSGKLVELAVRNVIHGQDVQNKDALANPEALGLFKDLPELQY